MIIIGQNETYSIRNAESFVKAGGLVKISDNQWRCALDGWGGVYYCAFDDPENIRPRGEWDYSNGELIINSIDEPVVFYATAEHSCVTVRDSNDITIDLSCRYAGLGVSVVDSSNVHVVINGHHLGIGVYIDGSRVTVEDYSLNDIAKAGIGFKNSCGGSRVSHGSLCRCGLGESSGSIYAGSTIGPVLVDDNVITKQAYGNYWPYDGAGVYADNGSVGIVYQNNIITDCQRAMHDNSGNINYFLQNKVRRCVETMKISDSHNHRKGEPVEAGTALL